MSGDYFTYFSSGGKKPTSPNRNPYGVIGKPKSRFTPPPGLSNATENAYTPPAQREAMYSTRNQTSTPSRSAKRDPAVPNHQPRVNSVDDHSRKREPRGYVPPAQRQEHSARSSNQTLPFHQNYQSHFDETEDHPVKREPSMYVPPVQRERPTKRGPSFSQNFQSPMQPTDNHSVKREPNVYTPPAQRQEQTPKRDPSFSQNFQSPMQATDNHSVKREPNVYLPPAQRQEQAPKRDPSFSQNYQSHLKQDELPMKPDTGVYISPAQRQELSYYTEEPKRDPGSGYVSPKRDPAPYHTRSDHSPSPSNSYTPSQRYAQRNHFESSHIKRDPGYSRRKRSPETSPSPSSTSSTRSFNTFSSPKRLPSVHSQISSATSHPEIMNIQRALKDAESKSRKQDETISKLQKQVLTLNRKIQTHAQREKDSEQGTKKLRNQVKLKAQELARKTKMYTDLKFTRDNSQSTLQDLQAKVEANERELTTLREENQNLLRDSRKTKGELKKIKGKHRNELSVRTEEVDQLQKALSDMQKSLLQTQDLQELERRAYRNEIDKEQRKVDESEEAQKELLEKFRSQARQLETAELNLKETREKMHAQKMQLQLLEDSAIRLKHKEQEVLSLRTELKKPKINFKNDLTLKRKEEEIEQLRSQLSNRNDFSKQFRVEIINKQQQIEKLTEENMQSEEKFAEYEEQISALLEKIEDMQKLNAGPPPELVFQEEMVELMMQLKEKELELQEVKAQMQTVNASVDKIRNYEKAFQHVQAEMQKLETSRQVFQKEIAIQKKEIKDQKLVIMQRNEENKHLQESFSVAEEEKQKYLALLEKLQADNGDVNESLVSERDMLRGDLEAERAKQESVRSELERARTQNEELKLELSKLDDLQMRLEKVTQSRAAVQDELRQAKTDLQTIQEDAQKHEEYFDHELQSREQDIQTQRAVIEELQRRVESDLGLSEGPPTPTVGNVGNTSEVFQLKQIIAEQKITIENLLVNQSSVGVTSDDDITVQYEAQLAEYEIQTMELENRISELLQERLNPNMSTSSTEPNVQYEQKIAALEERLAIMQQQASVPSLNNSRNDQYEGRIADLEAENLEYLEQFADFEEKIASLQEALEVVDGNEQDMIPKSRWQADADEYQDEIKEFQQIIEQFQKREKRFLAESKKYQIKIDMMEQILEAKKSEGASDTLSADSNATFTEFKLKYEAEIEQLKNVIKQNRQEILSKEEQLSEMVKINQQSLEKSMANIEGRDELIAKLEESTKLRLKYEAEIEDLKKVMKENQEEILSNQEQLAEMEETVKFNEQSLEKSMANIEERDELIAKLQESLRGKDRMQAPGPKEPGEKLTEEIEEHKARNEEMKKTIEEQMQAINLLEKTISNMKNDTEHKDRLAEGFQKKAIKAMKENKEFSQTLQNYRDELEDKAAIITELTEQVQHLISSEAAALAMNNKLENMLQESSNLSKVAFADLKTAFAI